MAATMPVLPSVEQRAHRTITTLFDFIAAQGNTDYLGERVSQLQHSLQTAHLARLAGADSETVIAALLHDIGRFIPTLWDKMDPMIAPDGAFIGRGSHEVFGERYLRELGFSNKVAELVGAHVMAKRYLTAVDKGYYATLSDTSKKTLVIQGGIFTQDQVAEAQKDPLLEEKLAIRRWDDRAKDPDMKCDPLSTYKSAAVQSLVQSWSHITLHNRTYHVPNRPTVVICIDGFDPTYLSQGLEDGILPTFAKFISTGNGFHVTAKSCMPSFTNPNNVSIITGVPPSIHGIAGNFYLDRETGEERMITDASLLRGQTILQKLVQRGVRVAAITAKDKLRKILNHGLYENGTNTICFSAEKAAECTLSLLASESNGPTYGTERVSVEKWLGQKAPLQYSAELSVFVLDAGIKLLQEQRADVFYLTLSDYVQHKHAPGTKEANAFMAALDERIGKLHDLGAVIGVTGDHGMSAKSNRVDGSPNVLFLQDELEARFGLGSAKVICPITDPFVRHHGALGSFVRVYIDDASLMGKMVEFCKTLDQVETALEAREAAETFELPLDREGDFVVVAVKEAVIGSRKQDHDLSSLGDENLRSHGGVSEQDIPLVMNVPFPEEKMKAMEQRGWRNFDVFDLVLNAQGP